MNHNDQEFLVQKIRTQYTEKELTQLDSLKALDKKVKQPPLVFAVVLGTIAAIIMGSGMSLVMTDIGTMLGMTTEAAMLPGIVIGVVGMALALINYPVYNALLNARRKKYAGQILTLSDQIMNDR